MEITTKSNGDTNYKNYAIATQKDIGTTSFLDILNQTSSSINNIDTPNEKFTLSNVQITTGNILIDNLPAKNKGDVLYAIGQLNSIFNINILGNSDQFYKKDLTINITRILDLYGNEISSSEFETLSTSVSTLRDNGLISDEDYFYTLRWIETKKEAFRIKAQNEKNQDVIRELILKPKKNDIESSIFK